MNNDEGSVRLEKKSTEKGVAASGEVDYRTKAGTAWSHNFLNQKPWHPLSYPNQRRKWIAEQTHANKQRRAEEVAREFAQEQEYFRQTALLSNKEKEKVEMMKAVSFMYVRPPGYNPESAKAAEVVDERKKLEQDNPNPDSTSTAPVSDIKPDKKARPKDVFGRALPTEEEFEVLKNAPRLETGMPARPKPFGIEIRNVRCLRCGAFGHQSGDRECPLKDAVMPNEENRLKRDDPLTAIMAQTDTGEPLNWELKQKPGMSPPRGGFQPDDPNQQIVAEEIFDEYGGFLSGGNIPSLISNFTTKKSKKHSKHKNKHKYCSDSQDGRKIKKKEKKTLKRKKRSTQSSSSDSSDMERNEPYSGTDRREKKRENGRHKGHNRYPLGSDSRTNKSYTDSEDNEEKRKQVNSKHKKEKKYYSESSSSESYEYYRDRKKYLDSKHRHKKCYSESSGSDRSGPEGSYRRHEDDKERVKREARRHEKNTRYHCDSFDDDGDRKRREQKYPTDNGRHYYSRQSSDLRHNERRR